MLRTSFFVSVGLHVLIFSLVSAFVSPREKPRVLPEQRFKVEFTRQRIAANPTRTDERLNNAPRKTLAALVQRQTDFAPSLPVTQKRQRQPVNSLQIRFFDRSAAQQAAILTPASQRNPVLAQPDFVAAAQAFPTPAPTLKPTAAPTAKPTPIPKKKSKPVPAQQPTPAPAAKPTAIPTQQPAPMPTAVPAAVVARQIPEQAAKPPATAASTPGSSNLQSPRLMRQEKSEAEEEQGIEAQPDPDVLQRYLQEVVKKIDARKTYPRQARSKGWQGTVIIKVQIVSDGTVAQLELATPSAYDTLNKAALEAIKKARPFPKFPDEMKSPSLTINIPIQFTLK